MREHDGELCTAFSPCPGIPRTDDRSSLPLSHWESYVFQTCQKSFARGEEVIFFLAQAEKSGLPITVKFGA